MELVTSASSSRMEMLAHPASESAISAMPAKRAAGSAAPFGLYGRRILWPRRAMVECGDTRVAPVMSDSTMEAQNPLTSVISPPRRSRFGCFPNGWRSQGLRDQRSQRHDPGDRGRRRYARRPHGAAERFDNRGFTFFTNTESNKGRELAAVPKAAWCSTGRACAARCGCVARWSR